MPYLNPPPIERLVFDESQLREELRVAGVTHSTEIASALWKHISGGFFQWERTALGDKARLQTILNVLANIHGRISN